MVSSSIFPERHSQLECVTHKFLLVLLCVVGASMAEAQADSCPPPGWDHSALTALKAKGFEMDDKAQRAILADGLVACLAHRDPVLRDGVAYEAYATWLRAGALESRQVQELTVRLLTIISDGVETDPDGVARPFSALVLSELARTDRVKPHFPETLRTDMLTAAVNYLSAVRDYRGYEDDLGWRHGVAHGADWVMQLALNPAYGPDQLATLRAALLSQVSTQGQHAYTDSEPERLARAVLVLMHRKELSPDSWLPVLAQVAGPAPLSGWDDAWQSRRGLNQRHNVRLFLLALHRGVEQGDLADRAALLAAIDAGLKLSD